MAQHLRTNLLKHVLWTMTYKSDRRKHSHRCRCCWEIVQEGDEVLMLKHNKATWVLHDGCAHKPHTERNSWRDAFNTWGIQRLLALGYTEKSVERIHPDQWAVFLQMSNRGHLVGAA